MKQNALCDLVDVDPPLGEDVHPVAAREALDAEVDGGLVHARAAHHGHALAQREEARVQRVREADVVRRQRPAHARVAQQHAAAQHACDTRPLDLVNASRHRVTSLYKAAYGT